MKKLVIALLLFCGLSAQAQRILSLNNSLIDFNNQPAMYNAIAASLGADSQWQSRTQLGRTLLYHYNDGVSHQLAMAGGYDVLLLQEQSALPRIYPEVLMQSVILWKEALVARFGAECPKMVLSMNWAYSDDWSLFPEQTRQLMRSYLDAMREVPGVDVCPIGVAYKLIYEQEGEQACMTLYTDNRHPSLKATYLAACMEAATVLGISAEDIRYVPEGLSQEDAAAMRRYAALAAAEWRRYSMMSR